MEKLFLKLLNMSLTAGWLVLAILLLRPLLKKAPRWVSCALWGLVALRLLLPFSIESAFSLIPSSQPVPPSVVYQEPVEDTAPPVVNTPVVDTPVVDTPVVDTPVVDAPVVDAPVVDTPVVDAPVAKPPVVTPAPAPAKTPVQHATTAFTWVWVGGLIALLIYALDTYVELRLRLRGAVREQGNVWRSERIRTPFVLGVFRPRVYLPFGLTDRELPHVLAHEQAHIARRDHLAKPVGFLLLAVYWFNPLMWVAYTLLCRDIELACDERVVKTMVEEERRAYSTALLDCSIRRLTIAAYPLAFGEVGVKERVKHVLKYKKPAIWIVSLALVACVALTIGFFTVPKTEAEKAGSVFRVLETSSDVEGISLSLYSLTMREGTVYARVDTTIDKDPYSASYAITTSPDTTSLYRQEGEEWIDCRTTPADTTVASVRESGAGDYDPKKVWVSHDTVSLADFDLSKAGVYRLEQKIKVGEMNEKNGQPVVLTVTFEFDGADAMVNHADGSTFYPVACVYVADGTVTDALAKEQEKAHIFGKREDQDTEKVFQIGDWRIENAQLEKTEVGDLPFDTNGYEEINGRRLLDEQGNDTGYRFYYTWSKMVDFADGNSPLWLTYFDGDTCTAAYLMEPCGSQRDVVQFYAQLVRIEDTPVTVDAMQTFLEEHYNLLVDRYNTPAEMSLETIFYDGAGIDRDLQELSEAERQAVEASPNYWTYGSLSAFKKADMEAYLQKTLGTTELMASVPDRFTYVAEHDLYFLQRLDSNLMTPLVEKVEKGDEGQYLVTYRIKEEKDGQRYLVTLRKTDEGYQFISNQKLLAAVTTEERAKIESFLKEHYNMLGAHTYEAPYLIDLRMALYDGAGIARRMDELSEGERLAVINTPGYSEEMDCFVFSWFDIQEYVEKVVGYDAVSKDAMKDFLYASSYGRYFLQHTDTNLFTPVLVDVGVDADGYYTVTYTQESVGTFMVTLQKNKSGKSYVFCSNVKVD